MAHVSHRLKGAFEGALAGGGDPATSPLYVFGPFLRLLAVSGAGAVSFGAPIWMVVLTVVVVSLMYRHVMRWIPDGSGGSGLCEEEFGSWAVKVNASITAIEYTLTFLVSIAALVTFVADRADGLGRVERTVLALTFTFVVGLVVNRGPRLAARVFGPATFAVLLLLWVLVGAVLLRGDVRLPPFELAALMPPHLQTTLGGYVRLLALMTGIEVFANLVAAYEGPAEARARKAFGSLLIVMVSTLATMVVVGPAIYALADVNNTDMSVFTQTMDQLLPAPLAYAGTLVGIVVLLSAAAASAQGLQNLALGLRQRHYVPAVFGQRNRFDVADRPVFVQVFVVAVCFVAFGTHEETYLALYAAGVFILLGLTGWAAVKRLAREARQRTRIGRLAPGDGSSSARDFRSRRADLRGAVLRGCMDVPAARPSALRRLFPVSLTARYTRKGGGTAWPNAGRKEVLPAGVRARVAAVRAGSGRWLGRQRVGGRGRRARQLLALGSFRYRVPEPPR